MVIINEDWLSGESNILVLDNRDQEYIYLYNKRGKQLSSDGITYGIKKVCFRDLRWK